jgi:O-antigen/teichoic acid export membrane protein
MREDLARLSKTTLIYGLGGLLNRFINFLLLPVFTAYLTPTDYGIFAILGLVSFVTTSVFSLGLGAGLGPCYFNPERPGQEATAIWTSTGLLLVSALCLVGFGLWLAPGISAVAFQTPAHASLVRLTIVSAALNILMTPFALRLQFEERAGTFVVLTLVSTPLAFGITLWLVVGLGRGVQGLVEATLLGAGLSLLLLVAAAVPRMTFRFRWTMGKELLRLSLPMLPSFAFLFLLQHGNKYLLQWLRGVEEVGIYSLGFNMGLLLNLLVSAFQTAWYPYFMSFAERRDEAPAVFGRVFTYYVLGCGGLTLLFFLGARPVVTLMAHPAFLEAYVAVGLSATAQFCSGVFSLLLPGIYFARDLKYISLVQALAAVAALALNLALIPRYGHLGAALALAGGMLVLVLLQHGWNAYRGYLSPRLEWPRLKRFGAVFVAVALLSAWDPGVPPVGLALVATGMSGVLAVLLIALLTPEERAALRAGILLLAGRVPVRPMSRA